MNKVRTSNGAQPGSLSGEDDKRGRDVLLAARMTESVMQPHTVIASGLQPIVMSASMIEVGADGNTRMESIPETRLVSPRESAVMRLYRNHLLDIDAMRGATRYASAANRIFGGVRYRTIDLHAVSGAGCALSDCERDVQARRDYDLARGQLTPRQLYTIDSVMRFDMTVRDVGLALFGNSVGKSGKKHSEGKLCMMVDGLIVAAAESLAMAYGYSARQTPIGGLSGL
jgi:hypothetical protein